MTTSAFAQRNDRPFRPAVYKGAKIGAIAGGIGGAGFGAFLGVVIAAVCESDCENANALTYGLTGAGLGLLGGGVGGTILGGIIGGSTVHGSASVSPVYAAAKDDSTGNGLGARVAYTMDMKHLSIGPEAGYYRTHQPLWHVGLISRLGLGSDRRLEPYASLGGGLYSFNNRLNSSTNLGGYSAGVGVQGRNSAGRKTVFAEARWQENLTNSGTSADYGFYTLALGGSISW